jgi:hypothetical protein
MTKRILVIMIAAMLVATVSYAQGTGSLSGTAKDSKNNVVSDCKVQLRNVDTGQLVDTKQCGKDGAFAFTGLAAGSFVIEILSATGAIIGTSASIAVAAGAAITGVTVAASAAGAMAAAAAAGGAAAFFTTTGGILVIAGVGVGVTAGVVAATNNGSPSK